MPFLKNHSVSFYSEYSSIEEIKASMLEAVREAVKDEHKENVEVVGKNFRQDVKGNIIGIFNISLARKLFKITQPKLMLITLNFNINNNE